MNTSAPTGSAISVSSEHQAFILDNIPIVFIRDCLFQGGRASIAGPVMYSSVPVSPQFLIFNITNCQFFDNVASGYGSNLASVPVEVHFLTDMNATKFVGENEALVFDVFLLDSFGNIVIDPNFVIQVKLPVELSFRGNPNDLSNVVVSEYSRFKLLLGLGSLGVRFVPYELEIQVVTSSERSFVEPLSASVAIVNCRPGQIDVGGSCQDVRPTE